MVASCRNVSDTSADCDEAFAVPFAIELGEVVHFENLAEDIQLQ